MGKRDRGIEKVIDMYRYVDRKRRGTVERERQRERKTDAMEKNERNAHHTETQRHRHTYI